MLAVVSIAAALFLMSGSAQGKDVYRWTDERGTTHYADKVPKAYRGVARKVEIDVDAPAARKRAGENDDRGMPLVSSVPVPLAGSEAASAGSSGSSGASGSAGSDGSTPDCTSLRRQYWESQACFNQFRNANGSVKAEAFRYCREVQSPVERCGPLITEP